MSSKGKRRNYRQNDGQAAHNKKSRCTSLQAGDVGFLVFCAIGTESKAVRESYDLLKQYAEVEGGSDFASTAKSDQPSVDECDIEKALKSECENLKSEKHLFKAVDTGAKCSCFIKSDLKEEKPSNLAWRILSDLKAKGQSQSRFIQRFLPIDFTFRAISDTDFIDGCSKFTDQIIKNESDQFNTYAIVFRSRYNTNITKDMSYECLCNAMLSVNPNSKVDLENPDRVILVEIFSRVGCMALLRDYYPLSRYNLHEIVKKANAGETGETAASTHENAVEEPEKICENNEKEADVEEEKSAKNEDGKVD